MPVRVASSRWRVALALLTAAACLLAGVVLAFPALASAYHVEAGGRALDAAKVEAEASRRAVVHLEKAIGWDAGNAQAYRWLARARRRQRDWPGAVEDLTRYLALQPQNRLGHIELAELYEEMRAKIEGDQVTVDQILAAGTMRCGRDELLGTAPVTWNPADLTCRAAREWRQAAYTLVDLIAGGTQVEAAGRGEEAFIWFRRAIELEPELSDGWYHLALWYERQTQWPQAAAAYEQALTLGRLSLVPVSDLDYHAGLVYQSYLDPPALDRALALYESALAADRFSRPGLAADCHYRRGEILQGQGRPVDEYLVEFERAVAMSPGHAWVHARLGAAYYKRDGDIAAAEAELREAIRLSPGSKWMYVMLGDIYGQEGRTEQARDLYRQALDLDPDFREANERLQAIDDEP